MPVGQVQDLVMGLLQNGELPVPPTWIRLARLHILATKKRVDVFEDSTAEGERDRHSKHLRWRWLDVPVEWGSCRQRRDRTAAGEVLQLATPLLPEHAHQSEDKIGLAEGNSLGVDPDEHLRDLFLFHRRGQLYRLERVVAQIVNPVDRLIE